MLFLLLCGILFTTIKSQTFQNKVVQVAVAKIAQDMGTKITLGHFSYVFWKKVVIKNLTIYDLNGDTLIYANQLTVKYDAFDKANKTIFLDQIKLDGAKVHFVKDSAEKEFNYLFFIRYFGPKTPRDPNKPKVIWTISAKKAIINDGVFVFNNKNYAQPATRRFNENHIALSGINGVLDDFDIIDDSLHFNVRNLMARDKSGLAITQLKAEATISSIALKLNKLYARTENSIIKDELVFTYSSYDDFSDFINAVKIEAKLQEANISMKDIAYFYEPLWGNSEVFNISGKTNRSVSRLDVFDINLKYGKYTKMKGSVDFSGLPDIENTLIDSDIEYFSSNMAELGNLFDFATTPELNSIGLLEYKGNLIGFTHDFVTNGNWKTALGGAYTDLKFKYTDKQSIMDAGYSGLLKTEMLNLKPLMPANTLGSFSGTLKLNGNGLDPKTLSTKIDADIKSITFSNKLVENGKVEGTFNKGKFEGIAVVKDKHIDLDFEGIIDLNNTKPEFTIDANIAALDLSYFGLDTGYSILAGTLKSNLVGNDIDNIVGNLNASNIILLKNKKRFNIQELALLAEKEPGYRNIVIKSDLVNLSLNGDYTIGNLPVSFNNFMSNLSPAYFDFKPTKAKDVLNFDINVSDPTLLLSYLPENIRFSAFTLFGFYNERSNTLKVNLDAEKLDLYGYQIEGSKLEMVKEIGNPLIIALNSKTNRYNNTLIASTLKLNANLINNDLNFNLNAGADSLSYKAKVNGQLTFGKDTISMRFLNSGVDVHGRQWNIAEEGLVSYENNKIYINNLIVRSEKQFISADGFISDNSDDRLGVKFKNFEPGKLLYDLNLLVKDTLKGLANGYLYLSNLYKIPLIESDFIFSQAQWNSDTIGDLKVIAKNIDKETLELTGTEVLSGPFKGLNIAGLLDINAQHQNFDLRLTLPKSEISIVSNFLTGVISDIGGYATGQNITLKGTFDKPILNGEVILSDAKFTVDYLNTTYLIRDAKINLRENAFAINPTQIYDVNNQSGLVGGKITHKYFSQWFFDIGIDNINNMQLLNTNSKQNDLFYGTGYGSGTASFKGPLEGLNIFMKLKTEKGTKVTLPLEQEEAQTSISYIKFVKEDINERKAKKAFSNINSIVIDIDATTDATAEMVFDSKVGDVLSGRGSGNLKFELNKAADLFMYGTYTVEEGKYLFTAFNFVNKPFTMQKGGTIFWDGDPFNAKIDLSAIYKQKASLSPLVNPADYASNAEYERAVDRFRTPIDVYSKLNLTGLLFTPKIEFDIEFPKANLVQGSSLEVTQLKNRFATDPQELNKQFLSLLVFNRFLPVNLSGISSLASSAPGQSASEMLSAQLNNWVSDLGLGIIDNISFDFGRDTADRRELVVSAEKSLFDSRLTIKGAYGNSVGSNATNVSVEYNITKDGNLQIRTNYTPFYYSTLFTNTNQQGLGGVRRGTVGVFFRREFETIIKSKK